ncbi:hypothetical protein EDC56_0572 [Sinobacterium caligoides]|uniref:O-antigen ligase-like membrane protein n=1 Tax=Sinobacterium caligoides TaxID=933926 RepID=A0A3N2DYV9_9GAMM|nr:hypothetical protein [Sinobacterium caligoides]ROS05050.1 hypothetical protein EDC56_0572 [Sinobacterium caligoides]
MFFLYLTLFWLPFSVDVLTFELVGGTWTLFILGVAFLLPTAMISYLSRVTRMNTSVDFYLLSICFLYLIHLFFVDDVSASAYKAIHGVIIPMATYFLLKGMVVTEKGYVSSVRALVFGFSVFSVFYVLEIYRTGFGVRIDVFDRDAISVGAFSVFVIVFSLYTNLFKGWVKWFLILLNSLSLMGTLSRAYMVTVAVSPVFNRFVSGRSVCRVYTLFMIVTLFFSVFFVFNSSFFKPSGWDPKLENSLERLTNIDYWKNGVYGRLKTFEPSVEKFVDKPVFGNGFSSAKNSSTVHNFHLEWLEFGGAVGYVLFFMVFYSHFNRVSKFFYNDKYLVVSSYYMLFMFVNGLMNGVMHGVMPYMLFCVLGLGEARIQLLSVVRGKEAMAYKKTLISEAA